MKCAQYASNTIRATIIKTVVANTLFALRKEANQEKCALNSFGLKTGPGTS